MTATKPTTADDLATIRAIYDANRQVLELLPAALEAAVRLGEADYAGASNAADALAAAGAGTMKGTGGALAQDLQMLLEAEGVPRDEPGRGDQRERDLLKRLERALVNYLDRAS